MVNLYLVQVVDCIFALGGMVSRTHCISDLHHFRYGMHDDLKKKLE